MQLKKGTFCPLIKKDCLQLKCNWFIQMRGTNPNTGEEINEWGCTLSWLPTLIIENCTQARRVGAATQSFKEEYVKANERTVKTIIGIATHHARQQDQNEKVIRIEYEQTDHNKE